MALILLVFSHFLVLVHTDHLPPCYIPYADKTLFMTKIYDSSFNARLIASDTVTLSRSTDASISFAVT